MSPRTIHFRVLDKSPVSGPGRVSPSCNKWRPRRDIFFAETDILTTQGTQGPACLPMDRTQRPQLVPFVPGLLTRTTGQSAPTGEEQETLLTSPLPSLCPLLSPSHPSRFPRPPVLDAGIWSKGLSLSWGLETDHLLLAENSNSGLVSGRAEFQPSLFWKPREKSRNAWVSAGGRRRL